MNLRTIKHRTNRRNGIHWNAHAQPIAPMTVRPAYPWNELEAARNDAQTVANIRDHMLRIRGIRLVP